LGVGPENNGATFSFIMGGRNNLIDRGSQQGSMFIIGSNITANTSYNNTTYVNNLNIYDTPQTTGTTQDILVRASDGTVKTTDINTLISGATETPSLMGFLPYYHRTSITEGDIQPTYNFILDGLLGTGKTNFNGGTFSVISAGLGNTIWDKPGMVGAGIFAGTGNTINFESNHSAILGGENNFLGGDGWWYTNDDFQQKPVGPRPAMEGDAASTLHHAFIVGGQYNSIDGQSAYCGIVGGIKNRIAVSVTKQ
jgi:hypothetical protein